MNFDLEAHEAKYLERKHTEAQAARDHKAALFSIAQTLNIAALNYAANRTPLTDASLTENQVILSYDRSQLHITINGEDDFEVRKKYANSTTPQIAPGQRVNRDEMLDHIVQFVIDRG